MAETKGEGRGHLAPAGLALSAVAISTSAPLVVASAADGLSIAVLRVAFMAAIVCGALLATRGVAGFAIARREALVLLGLGVVLGAHFGFWVPSVRSTTVTASTVLVTSHPLLVAVLSHLWLKEKVSRAALAGIAVAMAGVAIIFGSDLGTSNIVGDLLAVGGAVTVAFYLLGGRLKRRDGLPVLTYTAFVYTGAAVSLTVVALALSVPVLTVSTSDLLLIFAMALVPGMLGHTLYNWALRYLRATAVSATHLIEPIGASLLTLWIFGQQPPPLTALGAAVTLAGVALVVRAEARAASAISAPAG